MKNNFVYKLRLQEKSLFKEENLIEKLLPLFTGPIRHSKVKQKTNKKIKVIKHMT